MNDEEVLALYYSGNPSASAEADRLYGNYCRSIASNILTDPRDVEECVSDALLTAWQTVPEAKPKRLGAYLARLTRNAALNRYRSFTAEKRGGGAAELAFSEIGEIVSPHGNPEDEAVTHELSEVISEFIRGLPDGQREMFIDFFWYFEKPAEIALKHGKTRNNVHTQMRKILKKLQKYLIERGFYQ